MLQIIFLMSLVFFHLVASEKRYTEVTQSEEREITNQNGNVAYERLVIHLLFSKKPRRGFEKRVIKRTYHETRCPAEGALYGILIKEEECNPDHFMNHEGWSKCKKEKNGACLIQ